ncbi:MAG TPA: UDP-N-acetylmuramoyl-L-alanyl-D-glutamate--2,6-diaminopimelate ligase [Pseudonocardiaceae bacterium]|nr:UDP-N-acetylmuramoyl-L-alanyl-D-glutamate--2,6-diaminopimelate ligase [Pseudonocardiaceae bacterium]
MIGARSVGSASGEPAQVVGVTLRAQQVRAGDLFAALPGSRAHGADFAADALAAGAAAVLTDPAGAAHPTLRDVDVPVLVHDDPRAVLGLLASRVYGDPSSKLAVLGVTGTSGKTTTTYLVESGLRAAGLTTGLIGTVQTQIAGERLASAFTTPEAPDLQALLALMVEQGVTHVPMEVSSHALALGRVTGIGFAVGAFTNLSQDHLDFHADMADYFAAKAKLFDGRSAVEIVDVDGEWGRRLVCPNTVTVSTERPPGAASWTAEDVRTADDGGQRFTAIGPDGQRIPIDLRLPGAFNIANGLLAAAILTAAGVDAADISRGLAAVRVPGRMESVDAGQDFTAVVDYSHKPAAVALALDAVHAQLRRAGSTGRVIMVLGCGGERDTAKRPLMGEAAARRSELLVVTDDNPRGEDPAVIRSAMLAGALAVPAVERGEIVEIGDRREAIRHAVASAHRGDVVVVAGKGHETGQEIAGVVHPFSDRDELAAAIRARVGRQVSSQ